MSSILDICCLHKVILLSAEVFGVIETSLLAMGLVSKHGRYRGLREILGLMGEKKYGENNSQRIMDSNKIFEQGR